MKFYIEEIRKQQDISLSELSRLSGVAKSTIFYIEIGATDAKIGTLCKIAKALDIPIYRLFSCE